MTTQFFYDNMPLEVRKLSIGTRIKELRELKQLTQEELAKMVGVTPSAIGNYENGVSCPKEQVLYKLFDALDCDANYLYQDELSNSSEDKDLLRYLQHLRTRPELKMLFSVTKNATKEEIEKAVKIIETMLGK